MPDPLVSVVIPAYNRARFVGQAIDSALGQVNCRVEVIVVDDGSTDGTWAVLTSFGDRIKAIRQANGGVSSARNTGISAATGEWVSFLDSDDYWHPQKTERQLQAVAATPEVGVIGTNGGDQMPAELPTDAPLRALTVRDLLCATPITASSTMVRRQCFEQVGVFNTTLAGAEDRDMWLRLAARVPVRQLQLPCWHYRLHAGQASKNPDLMCSHYARMLDQFFAEHPECAHLAPLGYGFFYLDAAIAYADAGRMHEARRYLAKSIVRHPANLSTVPWRRAKLLVRFCAGSAAEPVKRLLRLSGTTKTASSPG